MKKLIAIIAVIAAFVGFTGMVFSQESDTPFVSKAVLVGRGFGIPDGGSLENLLWIDKIAVGAVKKSDQERRVGIFKWTDAEGEHKAKIRNIQWNNDTETVTADIFAKPDNNESNQTNETKIGQLSLTFKTVSGKEAWTGSLEINSWTGQAIIQVHKIKVEREHKMRVIAEERERGDCGNDENCALHGHARRAREDARDREALREACAREENKEKCKRLLEQGDVKMRTHMARIMSAEALSAMGVMEGTLQQLESGQMMPKQRMEIRERLDVLRRRSGRNAGPG